MKNQVIFVVVRYEEIDRAYVATFLNGLVMASENVSIVSDKTFKLNKTYISAEELIAVLPGTTLELYDCIKPSPMSLEAIREMLISEDILKNVECEWRLHALHIDSAANLHLNEFVFLSKSFEEAFGQIQNDKDMRLMRIDKVYRVVGGNKIPYDLDSVPSAIAKSAEEYIAPFRNKKIWIQVGNIDVSVQMTDEGVVIDTFAMDDEARSTSLDSTYTFFNDCLGFND